MAENNKITISSEEELFSEDSIQKQYREELGKMMLDKYETMMMYDMEKASYDFTDISDEVWKLARKHRCPREFIETHFPEELKND